MQTYLDSSLIVSLYSNDANSNAAMLASARLKVTPIVSALGQLEVINALGLRAFRREISSTEASAAIGKFNDNLRAGAYELRPVPESAFLRAMQISQGSTQKMGTRSADILHVAAALELGAKAFYSFDLQQRKLAESLGLTLNPV